MKFKRVIVALSTDNDLYELDVVRDGLLVKDIIFRRDGYNGIYKPGQDESHYLVLLVNSISEKEAVYKLIPASKMNELTLVDVEVKEEEPGAETATKMAKVG